MPIHARQPAVLTGAAAAAQLGLDGFVDRAWPLLWCGPTTLRPAENLIRTTSTLAPSVVGELMVAHPALVLRHLGYQVGLLSFDAKLTARDRMELAVEHALRANLVTLDELWSPQSRSPGHRLLPEILRLRGHEPPAESYAEVRAIQILRSWGLNCWRQLHIYERGRVAHRVDIVVPFHQLANRPEFLGPEHGLLLEIDSRQFHERRFEEDRSRQTTYDVLGFSWTAFTPNQFEHHPARVRRAFDAVYSTARALHGNTPQRRRNTPTRKSA
jgi:hypothetical protein